MAEEWDEYDGGEVQERHRNASRIRVAADVAVIPERAFLNCINLRVVDLSNVTTISDWAFSGCYSLERVVWPTASAVEIGNYAFRLCSSFTEIDLRNVSKIGAGAFMNCKALERVSIPSSVVDIDDSAFHFCTNLTDVDLSEGVQCIGERAFRYCNALIRIKIPASVTDIAEHAFYGCNNLAEVELCEGLQQIRGSAFSYCTSLQSISIPSKTLKIGRCAFNSCDQLRDVELREGLRMLGEGAFRGCTSLEQITIPSSVKSVGSGVFWDCNSLAEVTLREGVLCIDSGAFSGYGYRALEQINIPPVTLVIDIELSSCQLLRNTMPKPVGGRRTVVVSKWMQYRSPSQLRQAEAKVNEILGRRRQPEGQQIALIREWFTYYNLLDVTTMLELAIWRCNIGDEQYAEARQASRQNCGTDMNVIIPGVLEYLERS